MPTSPRARVVLFARANDRDQITVADIFRQETVGGIVLLLATVAAVLWANLAPEAYGVVQHLYLGPLNLQHWAADGLLTIFFFVAGLELKRELTLGSLSQPSRAVVPIVAAACGMAVPALVYLVINVALPGGQLDGWAIPMATDIAFALAVLAVVGRQLPTSLRAFLLTLAIVDDLGAILVIALAFTAGLSLAWLGLALVGAGLWFLLQNRRVSGWYIYLPLGLLTWWCMHESGVHATIAGVLLGLLTRASRSDASAPNERWEHLWRPVSAAVAVPAFALMSAGVRLSPDILRELISAPIALGIVAGLVVGKSVGIFGGAWLTARFTRAELADDLIWREVLAIAVLGGVGFTVSLLISELAFSFDGAIEDQAKAAVLIGSLIAALLAAVLLRRRSRARGQTADTLTTRGH
ncbi:MAG: Na+/H+ antiporter NhaA [Propionibacteriaceae bacterium]